MRFAALWVSLATIGSVAACGGQSPQHREHDRLRIDIDKSNPERLLGYYFGSYLPNQGVVDSVLVHDGGASWIDTALFREFAGSVAGNLVDADENGIVDWDELSAFIEETYYHARGAPTTLDALRAETGYSEGSDWTHIDVDGVMTAARRRLYFNVPAVIEALRGYLENDRKLVYRIGTTFVGEHLDDGRHVETTAMRKRADGYWDYFVFDEAGDLATSTTTLPKPLRAPVQCVGCHFGTRSFEPERSFPAAARPGPSGPRGIYGDAVVRNREVVSFFDEHRKRSDTVLGVYATLVVSQWIADRGTNRLTPEAAEILTELGL